MKNASGLTLIEVLIALAIIGIALTAVIKAATQNIRATSYLQDKTIAMWVGQEVLNEARVGVLTLSSRDKVKRTTSMLGKEWYWQAVQEDTPNQNIKKIKVKVFANGNEDDDQTSLINLETYIYPEKNN